MTNQQQLFKGERMEEDLRSYFLRSGFFVVRGVPFDFKGEVVTDVDLLLYAKTGATTRQRVNVDIKNKDRPKGFERVLWANGVTRLLGFDATMVATTDKRAVLKEFGRLHKTTIIDGTFLLTLKGQHFAADAANERLDEETLLQDFRKVRTYKTAGPRDWKTIYEGSKARLLSRYDFSGLNDAIDDLHPFLVSAITDQQNRAIATRMIYVLLSHILLLADFIVKDFAFESPEEKTRVLRDGLNFGNLGRYGADQIFRIAEQATQTRITSEMRGRMLDERIVHLVEFFQKNETARNLFLWAKEFEAIAFAVSLVAPQELPNHLRSVIAVFLDYFVLQRKDLL